ncbi:MAG: VanZ family protein [Turicibacter sp.]|nr:VanZ family protein [Turicibacter sp.]
MALFTFEPHWSFFLILYILSLIFYYLATIKKRNKWLDRNLIINAFLTFYIIAVLRLVFTPIDIWFNMDYRDDFISGFLQQETWTRWDIAHINLVPLRSFIQNLSAPLSFWRVTLRNVGGNFIMLLPLPIFLGLLMKKEFSFKKAVLIGFLTSFSIEIIQLIINLSTGWPNRFVCVDDLLLNTLGVALGYYIFKKYHSFFEMIVEQMYKFLI